MLDIDPNQPSIIEIPGLLRLEECAVLIDKIETLGPVIAPINGLSGFEVRTDVRNKERVMFSGARRLLLGHVPEILSMSRTRGAPWLPRQAPWRLTLLFYQHVGECLMSVKQIRLSSQAKEQLIRLKTRTGIQHWNILCRWAFCLSLSEPTPPTPIDIPADSNVEMSWAVFGGDCHELYLALLLERCARDGLDTTSETLTRQLRLHLHRGIGYLATPNKIRSIGDLVGLVGTSS